jgi:hypothetical protein
VAGSLWVAEGRSFVFIDIPASIPQFLKLLLFPFPGGEDILSKAAVRVNPNSEVGVGVV